MKTQVVNKKTSSSQAAFPQADYTNNHVTSSHFVILKMYAVSSRHTECWRSVSMLTWLLAPLAGNEANSTRLSGKVKVSLLCACQTYLDSLGWLGGVKGLLDALILLLKQSSRPL